MAAYAPLHTWLDGDVVLAADLQGEMDNVRDYLRKLPADAFKNSPIVEPRHIMRGDYDPVQNIATMVSGSYGGISVKRDADFTYMTAGNSHALDQDVYAVVPLTGMTLEVRRPVTILSTWWMSAASPKAGAGGGKTHLYLYEGNVSVRPALAGVVREENTTSDHYREFRNVPGGFHISNYPQGTYRLGLCCTATQARAVAFAWGLSMEAMAM